MKHLKLEELILHYYGEPSAAETDGATVESHLASCDACRAEYRSLQRVLNTVETLPVPERGPEYGGQVWRRLAPRLDVKRPWTWRSWWNFRNLALAGAMASVILLAFLAGRHLQRPAPEPTAAANQGRVRERILLVAMGDHLERSQMVLAELANSGGHGRGLMNISYEQTTAQELVESNRLYRQTAVSSGDTATANLLDDLERVLLEIVHSPPDASAQDLADLRKQIEDRGILFKVRVFASRVRDREEKPNSVVY